MRKTSGQGISMHDKFFDPDRFCEVYSGTVVQAYLSVGIIPSRTLFVRPYDDKEKWLYIDGFFMDIAMGSEIEICLFNGSIRLASRKSNNYVVMTSQILNLEIIYCPKPYKAEYYMKKEAALKKYINHMQTGMLGCNLDTRRHYISWARGLISNLRRNKKYDPERFEALEKRREEVRQVFLGQEISLRKSWEEYYDEFEKIDDELTSPWNEDSTLDDLDDI